MKISLLLVVCLAWLVVDNVSSRKLSRTSMKLVDSPHRLEKRDIFDDIRNAINSVGDTFGGVFEQIKTFTVEKFNDFKESLANLNQEDLEKARQKLQEYYNNLRDKTSVGAERLKDTLDQLNADITSGSSKTSLSVVSTLFVLLFTLLFH